MAVEVGRGEIPISADMDGFTRDVSKRASAVGEDAGKKLNTGMAPQLKQLGAAIGGVFAAQQAAQFIGDTISAASDLNETVSKSRTIFGPAAADLEKWASTAAKSFGQSRQQALDAAGTFGNLFVQLGIGSDQAAKMSKQMVELASDFASFHNANPVDVIQAQTAAFRGEYDALQRFVPTINAAAVAQKAMEMTGKANTAALTEQDKALAVNALMMAGAGDAAGDFARTSDGLANKQRIQSAQWEDLKVKIGSGFLPVMTAVTSFIVEKVVPAISSLVDWIGEMRDKIAKAWQESETFRDVVHKVGEKLGEVGQGFRDLSVAAITAFAWITRVVEDAWRIIEPIVKKIADGIGRITSLVDRLPGASGFLKSAASSALGPIGGIVGGNANGVRGWTGGPSVVGESGAELVDVPTGADIYNNGETNGILAELRAIHAEIEKTRRDNWILPRT